MISNDAKKSEIFELTSKVAKFDIGQLVTHKLFDYRGVIIDIDPIYLGLDEWYQKMARTRPPKNAPWYKLLVNNSQFETYAAECNLQADKTSSSIEHPMLDSYFDEFQNGKYVNHSWYKN